MEEQKTYTYETTTRTPVNKEKVALAVIALLVLAAAAFCGVHFGKDRAEQESQAAYEEESRLAAEAATEAPMPYSAGDYVIKTDGYTLLLRDSPSKAAADRAEIPDKTEITISEVTEDPAPEDENYRYWGKTEYDGQTGWVPMYYLEPQQN